MSETRTPEIIWEVSLPGCKGKKQLKIELFPASLWREYAMRIKDRKRFSPKIPSLPDAMNEYYATRYRIRVNGRFVLGPKKTFLTFSKEEIFQKYMA